MASMNAATGLLGGDTYFLHWGVVQISITNFVIILLMVVVFVLALLLPFPRPPDEKDRGDGRDV